MVTGFEKETHELTDYETNKVVPAIVRKIKHNYGAKRAVTGKVIIRELDGMGMKTTAPRLRKMINYIRINNLVYNLVASSKGYYIANSPAECRRFIKSLDERANAIILVRDAMKYQLDKSVKKD